MLGKNLIKAAAGNAGEVLGIEDVFSTWLYTGNGSTQTITNGIDLAGEGGLVWIKNRSGIANHVLTDTVRGPNKLIYPNSTNAEVTGSWGVNSFSNTGFGITGSDQVNNTNAAIYASWTFRKAPGFFDVVTYTGNGSNRTIAHNLGSVPGTIIVKRTDTAADWQVYHRNLANTEYMVLNSTAAKATGTTRWNSTTPTSSVFSLGTDASVNASGGTYVAYLFAHDAGGFGDDGNDSVIKCGIYTGNNSTQEINLGWEPQWLLVKNRTSNLTDWILYDTMRKFEGQNTTVASDSKGLFPNLSDAEANKYRVHVTATGIKITNEVNVLVNQSGQEYIYIAIRRGPMKTPTSGTEVFNVLDTAGTGAATTVTTNIVTDLFFRKSSTTAFNWYALDRLRNNAALIPNATNAENTGITAFASGLFASNTGFTIADGTSSINGTGNDFSTYAFRRAPGFFDVVAYTGTGVARTVPHNLGVAPEFMIVKRRNLTEGWQVYVVPVSPSSTLELNTTNAAAAYTNRWDGASTATEIKLLTHASVNASGDTYIAYLFASLPGISKVGSYTGTGTTLSVDCGFTSGSRLVLIKRTDSTGDWYVWDTARGIVAANDPFLLLNSTAAENASTDYIDPLSSGFQISSTAPAAINANGGSYIFLAIS